MGLPSPGNSGCALPAVPSGADAMESKPILVSTGTRTCPVELGRDTKGCCAPVLGTAGSGASLLRTDAVTK